jgi:hypothetical protein
VQTDLAGAEWPQLPAAGSQINHRPTAATAKHGAAEQCVLGAAEHHRVLLGSLFAERLAPLLLHTHTLEAVILPWLQRLHGVPPPSSPFAGASHAMRCLRHLEIVLDDFELRALSRGAFFWLGVRAANSAINRTEPGSMNFVRLAAAMLSCRRLAPVLLSWEGLWEHMERLLTLKRPSDVHLAEALPQVRCRYLCLELEGGHHFGEKCSRRRLVRSCFYAVKHRALPKLLRNCGLTIIRSCEGSVDA